MFESIINENIRKLYLLLREIYTFPARNFMNGGAFPPLSVVLLLTYRCNCRCKHCFYYNDLNKKETELNIKNIELSKAEIFKLIKELSNLRVKNVTFHGGEPFMRPELLEILRYSNNLGLRTNITTNAALISKIRAKELIFSGLNNLCVSIDGPEKIHDMIRGEGTFKKALSAIESINKLKSKYKKKNPSINIACTITSFNLAYLEEIIKIFKNLNIDSIQFSPITWNSKKSIDLSKKVLVKFKKENSEVGSELMPDKLITLRPDILIQKKKRISLLAKKYGLNVFFPSFSSETEIEEYYKKEGSSMKRYCNYPWASAVISPGGYVYPCIPLSFLNTNFGNVKQKSFREIWNSSEYKSFRRLLNRSGKFLVCNKCCEMNRLKKIS